MASLSLIVRSYLQGEQSQRIRLSTLPAAKSHFCRPSPPSNLSKIDRRSAPRSGIFVLFSTKGPRTRSRDWLGPSSVILSEFAVREGNGNAVERSLRARSQHRCVREFLLHVRQQKANSLSGLSWRMRVRGPSTRGCFASRSSHGAQDDRGFGDFIPTANVFVVSISHSRKGEFGMTNKGGFRRLGLGLGRLEGLGCGSRCSACGG